MNASPSTEERVWSVLAHLSALAFGMGILLPIIGWSEQRRKSKYVSFQCLQALGYQSLGYTVWLLAYLVLFIVLMIVLALVAPPAGVGNRVVGLWSNLILLFAFGSLGIYMILPVLGAVSCALGREFRYPFMGRKLAAYLGYERSGDDPSAWLIEEHEDHWVASMGHFAVIIPIWGFIVPFTTWIMQGRRNAFLQFQSVQTSAYHVIVNLFYFGGLGFAFLSLIPLFALTGLEGSPNGSSPMGMTGLILFIALMLIAAVILLVMPLFHILGQWAGYRTLKGDNYHYPLLGRWVESRLNRNSAA